MKWLFKFFMGLCGFKYEHGRMTVVISGTKSIKITTNYTPREVWINLGSPCGAQVCGAELDCIDVRIVPDGFILIVTLASEYREIQWIALK